MPKAQRQSPANLVFGRPTRGITPIHSMALASAQANHSEKARELLSKQCNYYDSQAKDLPSLAVDTPVRVQNVNTGRWDRTGVIEDVGHNRDYRVRMDGGGHLRRNRIHIRPYKCEKRKERETLAAEMPAQPKMTRRQPDRYHAGGHY